MAAKLRVLMDLSMASRGYCGIAQDVRLLYKTLASCADVELTGLVYPWQQFGPLHNFLPPDAPRGDRLANQAAFLGALTDEEIKRSAFLPSRIVKKLCHYASTMFARRVQLDYLDVELLWQAIWRMLFSHTLSPADIPLVQNGRFLLSNLSDGKIYARLFTRRQPLALDTRDFDFLIVQGP